MRTRGVGRRRPVAACIFGVLLGAGAALGQPDDPPPDGDPFHRATAPIPSDDLAYGHELGPAAAEGERGEWAVVAWHVVVAPGAAWVQLKFEQGGLAGDPASDGARIRVTSLLDQGVQHLTAETLRQSGGRSAYFNGESVLVELVACAGAAPSRVRIAGVTAGRFVGFDSRTICGPTDDRVPSSEPGSARLLPTGCTAWLFDDLNRTFLTAGHCSLGLSAVVQFNVPPSLPDGTIVHPPPSDQYFIEPSSVQAANGGVGQDWGYFAAYPNSETGLSPRGAQGGVYELAEAAPAVEGQRIRITGYGLATAQLPASWSQVQMTHTGDYTGRSGSMVQYTTDTMGGNSGSPVFLADTKLVIGIHTHGGCTSGGGVNQGQSISHAPLRAALASPRGLCASGAADARGDLFASCDLNNNFGVVEAGAAVPRFGLMSRLGPRYTGLAYQPDLDAFYAIDADGYLWLAEATTGVSRRLGSVTGAGWLNSLAFDPQGRVLYAVSQMTGRLYRVNTATLAATPIGAATGGNIGALEFAAPGSLYAIDDRAAGSVLVRIDPATGNRWDVGALGLSLWDCNGLAFDPGPGVLYTIDATSGGLYRIDPATGAASYAGATGGVFGSGYGLAWRARPPECRADYNGSGGAPDDADVWAFFSDWLAGDARADFNRTGGVPDDADIAAFFAAFGEGC